MAIGSGPSPVITSKLPGHPATMQPVTYSIPATSYSTRHTILPAMLQQNINKYLSFNTTARLINS